MKTSDFDLAVDVLRSGDRARLTELRELLEGFPEGVDSFIGRRWILYAIDLGARTSVEWILEQHVDLSFRDEQGYTPLLVLIDSKRADRYELLDTLLRAGAPVNRKGINDWTPAHLAAARDDVGALRILVTHGADLRIRTDIDHCATPLEEARALGSARALAFLKASPNNGLQSAASRRITRSPRLKPRS